MSCGQPVISEDPHEGYEHAKDDGRQNGRPNRFDPKFGGNRRARIGALHKGALLLLRPNPEGQHREEHDKPSREEDRDRHRRGKWHVQAFVRTCERATYNGQTPYKSPFPKDELISSGLTQRQITTSPPDL